MLVVHNNQHSEPQFKLQLMVKCVSLQVDPYRICPCRGHIQQRMQGTANAPVGGISGYTYKALEMLMYGAFVAIHTRYWKCTHRG
jgi:hypothetical protein